MVFEKNKKYMIKVEVNGKLLHYTGTYLNSNEHFVTFRDKYGGIISYNWNFVVYYEPIVEKNVKEDDDGDKE
jgi:hypothetical protein